MELGTPAPKLGWLGAMTIVFGLPPKRSLTPQSEGVLERFAGASYLSLAGLEPTSRRHPRATRRNPPATRVGERADKGVVATVT